MPSARSVDLWTTPLGGRLPPWCVGRGLATTPQAHHQRKAESALFYRGRGDTLPSRRPAPGACLRPGFAASGHTRGGMISGKPQISWVFAVVTTDKTSKSETHAPKNFSRIH